MTTTTTFASLSVPAPDDTMEMSSPANRPIEDDIDIDFDDYQGGVQVTDDEQMVEDGETRPTTATDDMMEDDLVPSEVRHVDEEVMQDDVSQVQDTQPEEDDELIDYSEDELQDDAIDDTVILETMEEPDAPEDSGKDSGKDSIAQGQDTLTSNAFQAAPPATEDREVVEDVKSKAEQFEGRPISSDALLDLASGAADEIGSEAVDHIPMEPQAAVVADPVASDLPKEAAADDETRQQPLSVNTALTVQTDTPGTPTDTGLHPMTISYGDIQMPLFKSRRLPDGLLKDDNLASLSLGDLIKSCRQRLALKVGEVSEDQELVLGFDQLGLTLIEDSRASFECSLNDILEVYLQLQRNDGTTDIPPLSIVLTLQLKFGSSFSIFKQAAASGQGMSGFAFLQNNTGHQEDYYGEPYGDQEDGVDTGEGQGGDDHLENSHEESNYFAESYHDHGDEEYHARYAEGFEKAEYAAEATGDVGHEHSNQEHYHAEAQGEGYEDGDQDRTEVGLNDEYQGEDYVADALYNTAEQGATIGEELVGASNATVVGEANPAESVASSHTVQEESLHSTAGEYKDDIIDWEDDDLTSNNSEQTTDGQDDFSTLLTAYEEDFPKATDAENDSVDQAYDHAGFVEPHSPGANNADLTTQEHQAQNLGSEDFLQDHADDYGEEVAHVEQDGNEGDFEAANASGEQDEDEDEQADTYDEQQDQWHPDYQPGEDDEQFHTAQDLLNEDYEHRPDDNDDTAEGQEGLHKAVPPVGDGEYVEDNTHENLDEQIEFDDEEAEPQQHMDHTEAATAGSGSPPGKRSHDEIDGLEDDQPELKKARAS